MVLFCINNVEELCIHYLFTKSKQGESGQPLFSQESAKSTHRNIGKQQFNAKNIFFLFSIMLMFSVTSSCGHTLCSRLYYKFVLRTLSIGCSEIKKVNADKRIGTISFFIYTTIILCNNDFCWCFSFLVVTLHTPFNAWMYLFKNLFAIFSFC